MNEATLVMVCSRCRREISTKVSSAMLIDELEEKIIQALRQAQTHIEEAGITLFFCEECKEKYKLLLLDIAKSNFETLRAFYWPDFQKDCGGEE